MSNNSRKRKHSDIAQNNSDSEDLEFSDEEGTNVDGIYIPPPIKPVTSHKTNRRLVITKITNNFFKSYAQKVILGPFSNCFNAIVGPNGSGKSNVIDSMLFVFGYRATKIRSKNLSVLIHNSEKYQNVQSCTVAVHFCEILDEVNEGKYKVVEGSEFVVSRTANKDNSSFYEVNGRKVQFKEVAQLLRKHGIDLDHNRFLILQGEVEEIATMKCKGANDNETGMLEYLEDIIGTNRYKKPLDQLNEKVEDLSVLRAEKLNRMKLTEKELEQLQEPMEEAVGFLKMENKVAHCRNFIYQKNIYDFEEQNKEIEEDMKKITEVRETLLEKLKLIQHQKSEKEKIIKAEASKYETLERKKETFVEALNKANKKHEQLQADMIQLNSKRKKFKEQLVEENKKLADLETIPGKNKESIEECEKKEEEFTRKKEKLEEEKTKLLTSLRAETQHLQDEKEKLEIELGRLKKDVDETRSAYEIAESELNIYTSNEENEKEKLNKLQETVTNNEGTMKQRSEQISDLKKKIVLTEKSLNDAKHELTVVKQQEAQIDAEFKRKRIQLEETRSSEQMSKSRGKILDSLMQQKRQGNCEGLYGRLGDLGAIDQKYDVAISTACGPLDNIVVDTVETAQWCIEFLKRNDIGRATFIALDKQEYLRELANSRIQTPENVPRLFDLVRVQDDIVKTAFYYALRDTLVADNLDQASRIAYGRQRYRVVTLKGDLIEVSGTMSGGGKSVCKGRMGQSIATTNVNPKDIERMEAELRGYEEKLRTLFQKESSLESQINTLEPELKSMKINLEKFSRELQSLKEQQPQLIQQLNRQKNTTASTKSDPKQVQKLENVIKTKKLDFQKASERAQEIQVVVDRLNKEIQEKSSGKMKNVNKNLTEVTKNIDKHKTEITKLKVAITTSERNAKKSAEKIKNLEQSIVNAENNLRQMQEEKYEIAADAEKLLKCINEIKEQLESGEEEFKDLRKEIASLTKEENKLKLEQVDVDETVKNIKNKLNECKSSMHQWHAKLAQLKLHQFPNEENEELKKFTMEEVNARKIEGVENELQHALKSIKDAKPNLNVIQEYQSVQNIHKQRTEEVESVTTKRNEMRNWYEKVKNQRKDEFMVGYNVIKSNLKAVYQTITLGGDADFEIVDSFDPFSEGIQFYVRPPKKSWKSISSLSGGEKTLSSLALVFALHHYKPSPLYVMDEIDAALDFKNVSIIGHYIKEKTKNAQFIIISLRPNMFELCDNLVGIYKIFNCTQTITIDPNGFENNSEIEITSTHNNEENIDNQDQVVPDLNSETESNNENGLEPTPMEVS